ncbi:hypothetical protein M758_UG002500, partial [Ceratodon purpureus]
MAPRTISSASTGADATLAKTTTLGPDSTPQFKVQASTTLSKSGSRHSSRLKQQIRDQARAQSNTSDAASSQHKTPSSRRKFTCSDEDDMPLSKVARKRRLQLS